MTKHIQRTVVSGHATHLGGETAHCLHIMADNIRTGIYNHIEQLLAALHIRYKDLHGSVRTFCLEAAYQCSPMGGAEVREVVAVH